MGPLFFQNFLSPNPKTRDPIYKQLSLHSCRLIVLYFFLSQPTLWIQNIPKTYISLPKCQRLLRFLTASMMELAILRKLLLWCNCFVPCFDMNMYAGQTSCLRSFVEIPCLWINYVVCKLFYLWWHCCCFDMKPVRRPDVFCVPFMEIPCLWLNCLYVRSMRAALHKKTTDFFLFRGCKPTLRLKTLKVYTILSLFLFDSLQNIWLAVCCV